jgi:predicted NBD/HSP70 family sugar kinase
MPRTTLARNIKELVDLELVQQENTDVTTVGRPPVLFSVNPDGVHMVGIELSRSNIRVLICNALLEPVWVCDLAIDAKRNALDVFRSVTGLLEEHLRERPKERLIGVGIGSVGPLDLEHGILLNPSSFPNPTWQNIDLKDIFESKFETPVFIANGATTAVMGEHVIHAPRGVHSVIYINIGVGIRCGIIAKDMLLSGDSDTEGAYGHMIVEPGGRPCHCGKFGCIEAISTVPAIVNAFRSEIRKGRDSYLMSNMTLDSITFKDICIAADNDDPLAVQVLQEAANYMGIAIANIVNILHPQMVVLGGMISDTSDLYYREAVRTAQRMLYNPGHLRCAFRRPAWGHNAIAAGAAALVLSHYLQKGV